MKIKAPIWLAVGLMTTLLVSGCGSSDDDKVATAPPTPATVPDSAGASASSFINYLMTLSPNDETSEPLSLGNGFAVPAEEASEPQPLG